MYFFLLFLQGNHVTRTCVKLGLRNWWLIREWGMDKRGLDKSLFCEFSRSHQRYLLTPCRLISCESRRSIPFLMLLGRSTPMPSPSPLVLMWKEPMELSEVLCTESHC